VKIIKSQSTRLQDWKLVIGRELLMYGNISMSILNSHCNGSLLQVNAKFKGCAPNEATNGHRDGKLI